jgi:hypothetical protein
LQLAICYIVQEIIAQHPCQSKWKKSNYQTDPGTKGLRVVCTLTSSLTSIRCQGLHTQTQWNVTYINHFRVQSFFLYRRQEGTRIGATSVICWRHQRREPLGLVCIGPWNVKAACIQSGNMIALPFRGSTNHSGNN